jgi:hypothetical protein
MEMRNEKEPVVKKEHKHIHRCPVYDRLKKIILVHLKLIFTQCKVLYVGQGKEVGYDA